MIKIIFYLLVILLFLLGLALWPTIYGMPEPLKEFELFYLCILAGGAGGVLYCLRAVYLNACVQGKWSKHWETWYYLRPLVSLISGGVSYIFLKAGLLVLEAQEVESASNYGFLALAFIAGLNVDNFIKKIESIAESAWGIGRSRTSREDDK
ncbi:MAG: hypothetical protein P8179_05560 [Candidatus Thiodiazotropha sp.]